MAITGDFADPGHIVVIHWGPKRGGCHGHAVANCGGRDLFPARCVRTVRSPCGLALTESQRDLLCRTSADVTAPLTHSAYQGIIRSDDHGMLHSIRGNIDFEWHAPDIENEIRAHPIVVSDQRLGARLDFSQVVAHHRRATCLHSHSAQPIWVSVLQWR
jgi:hypothetical protein